MSNFKGIVRQLQESQSEDILFDMYEAIGEMVVELNSIRRRIETKLEVEEAHPAINAFDLPVEFTEALEKYNALLEQYHGNLISA